MTLVRRENLPPAFRVEIRVKNNRLIRAREALGYKSAKAAADALRIQYATLVRYETMSDSPLRADGVTWKDSAKAVADAFYAAPEDLWPEATRAIEKARASFETTSEQLREFAGTAEHQLIEEENRRTLRKAVLELDGRRRKALFLRVEEGQQLDEVGEELGVCRERARQIVEGAIGILVDKLQQGDGEERKSEPVVPIPTLARCYACGTMDNLFSGIRKDGKREYGCFRHKKSDWRDA